jgi:hypothetical protein
MPAFATARGVGQINLQNCGATDGGAATEVKNRRPGKTHFLSRIKGKRQLGRYGQIFCFRFSRKRASCLPSRLNERGVARDRHDTRGGEAVDVLVRSASDARTNDADADVKSCGPGIPVLMPCATRFARCRRRDDASHHAGRGQSSRSPGRARIIVKTIAQGMPDVGCTCGDCRLLFFCRRAMGCGQRPAFPAPSRSLGGHVHRKPRA